MATQLTEGGEVAATNLIDGAGDPSEVKVDQQMTGSASVMDGQ
eukprot:CAMPEP_0170499878 /NCGR_PEP_ID=MMETSP0208-20121228/32946_1 /TAXON_ID=197538 /ORGANISM="Strombidium inclinatum, Strain S3" /LENGTH=42 /DNA_ID= /DNA_START= /DNA_END= /DNA_ORIENTATION=